MERNKTLLMIFFCCLFFNFSDALFTAFFVDEGYATEANPLMNYLIQTFGIYIFILLKMLLATFSIIMLYALCHNKFAKAGLYFTFVLYFLINVYHIVALFYIFWVEFVHHLL
jgi:hypothetical protein